MLIHVSEVIFRARDCLPRLPNLFFGEGVSAEAVEGASVFLFIVLLVGSGLEIEWADLRANVGNVGRDLVNPRMGFLVLLIAVVSLDGVSEGDGSSSF